MAALIAQTVTQCPGTKLCVSGYSQGAQIAHNAAKLISPAQTSFINSVVLFGDPDDGEAFGKVSASNISTDCHIGDDICLHGDWILVPHLDHCLDADTEASFVVQKSGLKTVGGAASEVEFEDHWWKYCRRDDLHEESTYRYM